MHTIENGFFSANAYLTYIVATLVILQVWYFSSLFINRYGTNGVWDHVCLFINMYLLYYLADGTRLETGYYIRYNVAWGGSYCSISPCSISLSCAAAEA